MYPCKFVRFGAPPRPFVLNRVASCLQRRDACAFRAPVGLSAKPRNNTNNTHHMDKFLSYLKSPATYVIAIIGGIIVLAVPAIAKALTPVARAIPGSKA